ncbi:hypothetical protein LJB98_04975 [Bacteroidales bacterium OttesenSCG-928-M11]|nr:hypothetical protein [Bacteroidales bacterium OttesenSCG-928-M11]
MSIWYTVVPRRNPQKPQDAPLYYLQATSRGIIDFADVLKWACRNTTINPQEIELAMAMAYEKLEEYVSLGHTVSFGSMGHTRISIRSHGSEDPEDATPEKLMDIRLNFIFGREFKRFLQTVGLEKRPL